jgi:ABC-type phosphate transport system substrate-binding protein
MRILITILLCLLVAAVATADTGVIVVHPDVVVDDLDKATLRRIFLGKKSRWSDDTRIVPVTLKEGIVHQWFVEDLLDRTIAKYVTYWKQAIFTGRGVPPRSFATEDELMFYVSQTPGAIGYVATDTDVTQVLVVTVSE